MTTDRKLARSIHREFRAKPLSEFIASEFALATLGALVSRTRPSSVLEVGAGIGTITRFLLEHPRRPARMVSTEDHAACVDALARNLSGVDTRGWRLARSVAGVDPDEQFDVVIFDGTLSDASQHRFIRAGGWCFVEGRRSNTRAALERNLAAAGLGIKFEASRPVRAPIRLDWRKGPLGLSLPSIYRGRSKGCFVGRAVALDGGRLQSEAVSASDQRRAGSGANRASG